jgi:hypothetical protein
MLRLPLRFIVLWLLTVAALPAHDLLNSSTDIWLRPDSMQVDVVMARAMAVALLNGTPANLITDDNFDETYAPKLQEAAAGLLNFTLDGRPLPILLTKVALSEETDIKFSFVYSRPAAGRLRLTTPFMKKMSVGFENSIGIKEGTKVLGYADLRVDDPPWETTLSAPAAAATSTTSGQPAPTSASGTTQPMPVNSDIRLPIWAYLLITLGVFAIILFPEYQRRRKNKSPDDQSPWPPRR